MRLASCCSVEVVKGGGGLRLVRLRSIVATRKAPASTASFARAASAALASDELLELLPLQLAEPGGEALARRGRELGLDRPVFAGAEGLDLGLALADQAERHRLHAPGAAAARQLPPQHRGEGEAHQVVERAAGEIGLDQELVEVARGGHRGAHGAAGDLVEGDAPHRDALERVLLLQHPAHMPGDRLALAVRVGRQEERIGALQRLDDRRDLRRAPRVRLPVHGEVLLGPDAAVLGGQVAHMPEAREHGVPLAEVLVDRAGLGGGFDNDDVGHGILKLLR